MEKLKAVIYIRVSDESQIKNNSLETQLKICQGYAETNNLEVVEIFREEGFSAKHIHTRPEMRRLLAFCTTKKNKIARVVVYKMDRWTRNVEEGLMTNTLLAKYGVAVIPATEIADQTQMGKAMRTIFMAIAELDNGLKSERVRDTMKTMFAKGSWCWKPPIGYTRIKNNDGNTRGQPLSLDKNLTPILKQLFERAGSGYFSKISLANFMNQLGFEQFYGRKADGKLVAEILSKTFYYGYMYANKWKIYGWGSHEKLVEQDLWEKAFYNTFGKKRMLKHQDNNTYPLKGLIRCENCGHTMTSSNPKGRNGHHYYYECHNKVCPKKERIDIEGAHKQFLELLDGIQPSKRTLKLFSQLVFDEWDTTIEATRREAQAKDDQITKLEAKLTSIAESNSKGILNDEEARARAEETRRDITVLKIERSDIRIEQYDTEAVKNFTESFLTNLSRLWVELDLSQKQAFQGEVFPKGVLAKDWKIRTAELSQSFALIETLNGENFDLVTPLGFEPKLQE